MLDDTISDIQFEITQIDQLFTAYKDLFEQSQDNKLGLIEISAMATVLHSFYNGLENIFKRVAKGIDGNVPENAAWHRQLLSQMTQENEFRKAVLTAKSEESLKQYLNFRHFFRHSYAFFLDWDEMKDLVLSANAVWEQAKSEITLFLNQLNE